MYLIKEVVLLNHSNRFSRTIDCHLTRGPLSRLFTLQLEREKQERDKEPAFKDAVTKKDSQNLSSKPKAIPSPCKSPLRKHPALSTRVDESGASAETAVETEFSRVYNQLRRDKHELVM